MKIRYDKKKIEQITRNIYGFTSIKLTVLDMDWNLIYETRGPFDFCAQIHSCKQGGARCICDDRSLLDECRQKKQLVKHQCHAGLTEAIIPIKKDESVVGYIFIGGIRSALPFDEIVKRLDFFSFDYEYMEKSYMDIVSLTDSQLDCFADLLSHILFENAITLDDYDFRKKIHTYITDNLANNITTNTLCAFMHMSKNTLYRSFYDTFGCTINEYITRKRIKTAQTLLIKTEHSIADIAEMVGYPNHTYFSTLFKTHTGVSPSKYRSFASKEDIEK